MNIRIEDDFDLEKIAHCGQAFREQNIGEDRYRFIYKDYILYIRALDESGNYEVSADKAEWENVWTEYFDLNRNYNEIRKSISPDDIFLNECAKKGEGIRILKQDPFEMLITFIISQRKSIPAIASAVEAICKLYGRKVDTEYETIYLFPTVSELSKATFEELKGCGLGYRVDYVLDAVRQVESGMLNLEEIGKLDDEELKDALKEVRGVGEKVANCVSLFGYGRVGLAPVDVWIQRVIDEHYGGVNPFGKFGDIAGIMQQYMFYGAKN